MLNTKNHDKSEEDVRRMKFVSNWSVTQHFMSAIFLCLIFFEIPTFLGNNERNYYGSGPMPEKFDVIWKVDLGTGQTWVGGEMRSWSGCGWTGQPLIVEDDDTFYIIIGSYDHNLRKIDGRSGKVVWSYKFDDVIKGTGTIIENPNPKSDDDLNVILQGSRRGNNRNLASQVVPSYRAISFENGKELWRMDIPRTQSYSRDVDGSALVLNNLVYLGAENGIFYIIDPFKTEQRDGMLQPIVIKEIKLYSDDDIKLRGGNMVIESSPSICGNKIIVTTGAGHVYAIDPLSQEVVWDFYIGADLNGTPVVTNKGKIVVTVEKEGIPGNGGALLLNPDKEPEDAVCWYFPVPDRRLASWFGGIIGSPSINDYYNQNGKKPALVAFSSVYGNLYIVAQNQIEGLTKGPNGGDYPKPKEVFCFDIGSSISTPIFYGDDQKDWLIAASYNGLHIFAIDYIPCKPKHDSIRNVNGDHMDVRITKIGHFLTGISIEATPVIYDGKIFIGTRNGWFYCLGEKD